MTVGVWLEVREGEDSYPETYFATQIRGSAMAPEISSFEWKIFDADVSSRDAIDQIVLFHNDEIEYGYQNNLTIRKFSTREQASKGLFSSLRIILSPLNKDFDNIVLEEIQSDEEFEIVGKLVPTL